MLEKIYSTKLVIPKKMCGNTRLCMQSLGIYISNEHITLDDVINDRWFMQINFFELPNHISGLTIKQS